MVRLVSDVRNENRMRIKTIIYKAPILTFSNVLKKTGTGIDWSAEDPKIDEEKCGKPKLSQCGSS